MRLRIAIVLLVSLTASGCSPPVSPSSETPVSQPVVSSLNTPVAETTLDWIPSQVKTEHPVVGGWEDARAGDIIWFRSDASGYVAESSRREKVRSLDLDPPAGTSTWETQEFSYEPYGNALEMRFKSGRKRKAVLSDDRQSLLVFGRTFTRVSEAQIDIEFKVP